MIPQPATCWQLRTQTLRAGDLPLLMGVVNVTPDSFSDGGRFLDPQAAVEHGVRLVEAGAAILDIGGESTRPGAEPVSTQEQLRRVLPVLEALARQVRVPLSIDTSSAEVAAAAIAAGAEVVNDVTALCGDPRMASLVAETGCGVCLMHMQGTPRTMQQSPQYADVVTEVIEFLQTRRDVAEAAGVARGRIALDPGIGFGKELDHNLELLSRVGRLHALGCFVLVGHSRKRFIAGVNGVADADRGPGTIGVALALARRGVQVLRVHDVAAVRQALMLFQAAGGMER